MNLQTNDEKPLYKQLCEIIKQDISDGRYKRGEKIPTECELCKIYSVSRNTVRKALKELTRDNLLIRKQGKGTFVSKEKITRMLSIPPDSRSFTELCREVGCVPGAKVIRSIIEDATQEDLEIFNLRVGEKVIVIERIRYVDGTPVSIEVSRFPEQYNFLLHENLNDCSMYELLRDKYNTVFLAKNITVEIAFASYEISQYLGITSGYPLLFINSVQADIKNNPVHRSLQYIIGDKFKLLIL